MIAAMFANHAHLDKPITLLPVIAKELQTTVMAASKSTVGLVAKPAQET